MHPSRMLTDQKVQRHELYCVINPPKSGPMVGPSSVINVYILMESPLSSDLQTSPRTPAPITVEALSHEEDG